VTNNTDLNSTGIINGGFCSSNFGEQGIIKAHSSITIYKSQLQLACGTNTQACTTDLYMSNDCSGPKVGTITLNIDEGVTKVEATSDLKITSADPSHVQIDPASR
jgi:hypothetical protein